MGSNTNGFVDDELYNETYAMSATLLKLSSSVVALPLVTVPTLMVILAILNNKKLQTKNNLLAVNLLIADLGVALVQCCINVFLILAYLLDVEIDVSCNIVITLVLTWGMASKLMFLPMAINRFVCVAFPYSHKRIMTKNKIIVMITFLWLSAIVLSAASTLDHDLVYIPSLGICRSTGFSIIFVLVFVGPLMISTLLVGITSIYLRHKIIKSNKFIHGVTRHSSREDKAVKLGRLAETLREQLKPTLAVFILGGIDGLFNFLLPIVIVVVTYVHPFITQFQVVQFVLLPLQLCQTLSHSLSYGIYNKEIRDEIFGCRNICTKHSKVIVLNREH